MASWTDLQNELDAWSTAGRTATLWLRDDDAIDNTSELEQLIASSLTHGIPTALAVIPADATDALAARIDEQSGVTVLQHGLSHANHEPASQKKAELGSARNATEVLADIARGARLLSTKFHSSCPVLVPPWNRISPAVVPHLDDIGIKGLSTFRPRERDSSLPLIVNTHVDIIDWRGTRGFAGQANTLNQLVAHLGDRRSKKVDSTEPTGILTHHLVHDEECWQFLHGLFTLTREHAAVQWLSAQEIFTVDGAV